MPAEFLKSNQALSVPLLTRILYGGITEEILLRWGVMTLLVWLLWRCQAKQHQSPTTHHVLAGITIAALIFGMLHLPVVALLGVQMTGTLIIYIVLSNVFIGWIAGYLYWQKGLEAAMIAHAIFHVALTIKDAI